ncbi:MAG TPA: LssY C-terminal domain-containing protein [Microlunatus sp.]
MTSGADQALQGRGSQRPTAMLNRLDAILFAFAGLSTLWLAYLLVRESVRPGWPLLLLVIFWILLTYLLLPRLHRILTRIYVPRYFIGRAHTSDGLLGDPINLALRGDEAQLHLVMSRGGWRRADDLSLATGLQIVRSTLRRRSYAGAPVSPLLLFDRQQDFAYQQEVDGSPSKRHHVRFWRAPDGWMLPGGYAVDWVAAGSYDRSVGLSLFTLQITHKIEADIDVERDHVVGTMRRSCVGVEVVRNFSTGYHSRNGGGDRIRTDGDLPVIDVRHVSAASSSAIERTDSRDKRPAQIVVGAVIAGLRGLVFLLVGIAFLLPTEMLAQTPSQAGGPADLTTTAVVLLIILALGDIVLAIAVVNRRDWARIVLMLSSVVAVVAGFIDNARHLDVITLETLPTVGMSILILLALSSHRARDYTARHRHHARIEPGSTNEVDASSSESTPIEPRSGAGNLTE